MVNLDAQHITNEIDYYGSTVTLRTVTDGSYSKWGDASETTSDETSLKAMVQVLDQSDDLVQEGIFQTGDKIFWFKSTQTGLNRGNRIQHNSKWYEIDEVIEHDVADSSYVIEIRTKKI